MGPKICPSLESRRKTKEIGLDPEEEMSPTTSPSLALI